MNSVRIMLVEDESLVGLNIQHKIEDMGYHATAVWAEAEEALERLEQEAPDLVLMDIRLRGEMDGVDAAREIRNRHGIPVLFLTAYADIGIIKRAREVGAYGYLVKPVADRELQAMIEMALCKHKAELERQQLDGHIQRTQKFESLGVLAGGIADDFNNLLVGILGNASMLQKYFPPGSTRHTGLSEIETAAKCAADLCKQMLAYSGRGRFVIAPLDLNVLVKEMGERVAASISTNTVLDYALAESLPAIKADATQIRQVVMHLIANASEAIGGEAGVVTVATGVENCAEARCYDRDLDESQPKGPYVYLEVRDSGCGMSEEVRAKLFDPFFTTKFAGRGLGMSAVLGIVGGHKGAIRVDSTPSCGTTLRVLFPASTASTKEVPVKPKTAQRGGTILLVDDDEMVLRLSRKILEREGFTVLVARDGCEALECFREQADTISCVVLDLTMPRMGGAETFRKLRSIRNNVRVILVGGYDQEEITKGFGENGFAGFLQKPFGLRTLLGKITEILSEGV